jgi:hypothetical protein
MPVHGAAHDGFSGGDFVKEDVPIKRTKHKKVPPIAQPRVSKAAEGPNPRLLAQ